MDDIDLSKFDQIFCDSLDALKWARNNGLDENAIIKTNAPALLWGNNPLVQHIDNQWTKDNFKEFQEGIEGFADLIYKILYNDPFCCDFSLALAQESVILQKIVYKAACLKKDDLNSPRLFLKVTSDLEPNGSKINAIWDQLLLTNPEFRTLNYHIRNDKWKISDPTLIPFLDRLRFGGLETLFYRLAIGFWTKMPLGLSSKTILIPNENELIIETASALALKGAAVRRARLPKLKFDTQPQQFDEIKQKLEQLILPILNKWISNWVIPELVDTCQRLVINELNSALYEFLLLKKAWISELGSQSGNVIALINSPGNLQGVAFYQACKESGIDVVSAQHGVTNELMKLKNEWLVNHEVNVSDCCLVYNLASYNEMKKSPYAVGGACIVGMSNRHHRVNNTKLVKQDVPKIVYISTNLYKGNLNYFGGSVNDFDKAKRESSLISQVFAKLPYQVRYKAYPEDTRRYVDRDPVLSEVEAVKNIELFETKVDMRYLLAQHKIIVTSGATSTLGWAVLTKKPIVFINWEDHSPLNEEAYKSFSKGLFLFDGDKKDFHNQLVEFLSQPISDIELLWSHKVVDFNKMVEHYFSCCSTGAGKRAATMINQEYF